jgi:hypothetical protein
MPGPLSCHLPRASGGAGVCDILEQIDIGPDGGNLDVFWMEEIANYSFTSK